MSYQARDGGQHANTKPDLKQGWLGPQEMFSNLGMSLSSHRDPEVKVIGENEVEIVLKTRRDIPLKQVTKLLYAKNDNRNLANEYVLCQRNREDGEMRYRLGFTENGYYRFMIFALDEANKSDDLPNVFNYLIYVDRLHVKATPFPKQLSDFYDDYCLLLEPLRLNNQTISPNGSARFNLIVPGALKVAVHCEGEWTQLVQNTRSRNQWEGDVDLSKHRGKNNKLLSVGAHYGNKEDFVVLLDYSF